jgi:competence protein ComEA
MGRAERGVVLLLVGLAVAGHAVRRWADPGRRPGEAILLPGATPGNPTAQRTRATEETRPLRPGEQVDPDQASAAELARLPGVGMRLAKEIVSDREIRGPFGSAGAMARVDGIGPATVRRLEPFLHFRPTSTRSSPGVNLNSATQQELETLPGVGPSRARAIVAYRDRSGPFADPADLERVPGIGPRLATRLKPLVRVR